MDTQQIFSVTNMTALQQTSVFLSLLSAFVILVTLAFKAGGSKPGRFHVLLYAFLLIINMFTVSMLSSIELNGPPVVKFDEYHPLQKASIILNIIASGLIFFVFLAQLFGKNSKSVFLGFTGVGDRENSFAHILFYVFVLFCNMFVVTFFKGVPLP
jgi:uncharacterized membrane protein YtjA (UPF0391 family)